MDLATGRGLKWKESIQGTYSLLPSQPRAPVKQPLHSSQCWGALPSSAPQAQAVMAPHYGNSGGCTISWSSHPAHFLVSGSFLKLSPSPLWSIPSVVSQTLAEGRAHVPREGHHIQRERHPQPPQSWQLRILGHGGGRRGAGLRDWLWTLKMG